MRRHTLQFELSLIYILVLIFSLFINVFLYDYLYSKEYEKQILNASEQSLYSIDVALTTMVSNISDFSVSFLSNQNLQSLLKENNEEFSLVNGQKIETLIFGLSLSTNNVSSIAVYDLNSRVYQFSNESEWYPLISNDYKSMSWYEGVREKKGFSSVVFHEGNDLGPDDASLSVIRQINDLTDFQEIGLLSLNINMIKLREMLTSISEKYDSRILLLAEDGSDFLRINWDETEVGGQLDIESGASYITSIDGEEYAVSAASNSLTGLTIVNMTQAADINSNLFKLKLTTILIAIISMFMLMIGSLAISRKIIDPIHHLAQSMSEIIHDGTFKKVHIKTGNDEIGTLKDIYNVMIDRIQELIQNSVKEEKKKRRAELLALQEQIKPHFLYNTFDSISSLALSNETEDVYKMTTALSSYYRIRLSRGEALIPFDDEMEIIRNYISILKIRYRKAFRVEYQIEDSARAYNIPKLTLQPFVENSIYHGISPLGEEGLIQIRAWEEDRLLIIEIEDNGVGMEEEDIREIISNSKKNHKSFGVKTTMERIRLIFGGEGSVELRSRKHMGTTVTIRIPFKEDME